MEETEWSAREEAVEDAARRIRSAVLPRDQKGLFDSLGDARSPSGILKLEGYAHPMHTN